MPTSARSQVCRLQTQHGGTGRGRGGPAGGAGLTAGLHTPSPAHQPCTKALHSSPVHPAHSCTPSSAYGPCTPGLHTSPVYQPCTPAQPCKPAQSCTPSSAHGPCSKALHTSPVHPAWSCTPSSAHGPCTPGGHTSPVHPAQPCKPAQSCTPAPPTQPCTPSSAHRPGTPGLHTSLEHQPSPINQPSSAHQLCPLSPVHHILNTKSAHQISHLLCTPDISSRRWYPERRPRDHPPILSTTTGHSPRKAPDPGGPRAVTGQPPHPSPCRCSGLGGGQGGVLGIRPSPPNQISTRLHPHQGQAP